MPDRMPEDMPEDVPEHMPEDMPDRMPDRMPEDISDRMPEDLPVRKCINVMVGITRSKVICYCVCFFHSCGFAAGASWCLLFSRGRCPATCSPSTALLTVHPKQPCGEPECTVP